MTLNANWSRVSGADRTEEYRSWRTTLGVAGVCDVDQIEYRFVDGVLKVVGVVELCVADRISDENPRGVRYGCDPSPGFFAAVEAKVSPARAQGVCLRELARALSVPLLLVVYVAGEIQSGVWVLRVDGSNGWVKMSLLEFQRRLIVWEG